MKGSKAPPASVAVYPCAWIRFRGKKNRTPLSAEYKNRVRRLAPAKLRGLRQELADILGILDHNPITPPKRAADRKGEKKKTVEFPEKNKLF